MTLPDANNILNTTAASLDDTGLVKCSVQWIDGELVASVDIPCRIAVSIPPDAPPVQVEYICLNAVRAVLDYAAYTASRIKYVSRRVESEQQ